MSRPQVDVVVPFTGPEDARAALAQQLGRLLAEGDTATIVDNNKRPGPPWSSGPVRVVTDAQRAARTPACARNFGALQGRGEWILFLDSDVEPPDDLLARYFSSDPGPAVGVLAGGVDDAVACRNGRPGLAERYALLRRPMSQDTTFASEDWAFAQTANCAFRRAAFEDAGGFRSTVRAGEDADLCFRLRAAGWEVARRESARVRHFSRSTVRGLLRQQLVYGSGMAWLDRLYPGASPARRWPGTLWWGVRNAAGGIGRAARRRDADLALVSALDPLVMWAFELGRSVPNERPLLRRRPAVR